MPPERPAEPPAGDPLPSSTLEGQRLLASLGYDALPLRSPSRSTVEDWAESGLMDLTRDTAGRPLRPRGIPATVARGAAAALTAVTERRFGRVLAGGSLDGAALLAERAALAADAAASRAPQTSRGGRARFVRARDGWWVLHLARESDEQLVPALVEDDVTEPWRAVEQWAAALPAAVAVERAVMLGLAASVPGETAPASAPWSVRSSPGSASRRPRRGSDAPGRVVNLGALWAGPLAAQLLGEVGFEVVHVESSGRPDASRWGDPGLHELLHWGAQQVTLDFGSRGGREELAALVSSADVVIEASRPRAFEDLGIAARDVMADGRGRTWLQITGHGPDQPLRVGFGDDAAVAGGLLAEHPDGTPDFSGDALADPLTGLLGALAVAALHDPARATHVAVSLAGAAANCRAAGDVPWGEELPEALPPRHRGCRDDDKRS
ncbi:CoA transferase [Nocardioides sp. SYSU DS0651]|uniref:CoA transferase n=1 Tax=Nocardioides sp. SYSU DS0651 TaxID=3415955 RepID=UPI003F4AFF22